MYISTRQVVKHESVNCVRISKAVSTSINIVKPWTYIEKVLHNSYTMWTCGSPDICTLSIGPAALRFRVYISDKQLMPIDCVPMYVSTYVCIRI